MIAGLALLPYALVLAEALPHGAAGVNVGDPWSLVAERYPFHSLSEPVADSDRASYACGARNVLADLGVGTLQVQVQDFVVTAVTHITPIPKGADLLTLREQAVQRYGPPAAEVRRDAYGAQVSRREAVNYVQLSYTAEDPVRIEFSGPALWRSQVEIHYRDERLHQNKTQLCVRSRQAAGGS